MDASHNKSLCIWAVTDHKPGHRNQLQGLSDALTRIASPDLTVETHWLGVPVKKADNLATLFNRHHLSISDNPPDYIICCGHRTHWQALYLRWRFGAKLIVLMKPTLPLSWFDLCVIPYHDGDFKQGNVFQTQGVLNKVTPAPAFTARANGLKEGLILIGGPSRHYSWDNKNIIEQLKQLIAETTDTHWTLSTSRRTPEQFETLAASLESDQITLVPVSKTDEHWLPRQFQQSESIWVTEDSVSMVYESLSSGAKVGLLSVPVKQDNRITRGVERLCAEQRLIKLGSATSGETPAINAPLQEANRIASLILTKAGGLT